MRWTEIAARTAGCHGRRGVGLARACAAVGLLSHVAGCATVRDARQAQETGSIPWGERTADAATMGLAATSVLSVDEAVSLARTHHPSVVQARQAVLGAELALDNVRGGRRPGVSASGSAGRGTSNREGGRFSGSSEASYSAGLSFDWLLYDFGKTDARTRQAIDACMAAEQDFRASALDVDYGVRSAFIGLLRAEALLAVSVENREQVARQAEQAQVLAEYGRRQPYDVTRAQVQLGAASLEVVTTSNAVASARAALNRSLGLAEDPGYSLAPLVLDSPSRSLADWMAAARLGNPELAALLARARAASAAVDAAIADLAPDVKIGLDASLSGGSFPLVANLSSVLRATASLWDGGLRANRIKAAVSDLRSARARVADKEQQLFEELTRAAAQRQASEDRLRLAESTAVSARENAEITAQRYRLGAASAIEQADAQSAVTQALAEQVQARCDRWLAIAEIARLTGRGPTEDVGAAEDPK